MNMTSVKPDKEKFASVGYNIKSLNIYNNDGTLIKELIMKAPDDLVSEVPINRNALIFYDAIKATNKYIYVICEEAPFDNLLENRPKLEVWDWDAGPLYLSHLATDRETTYLSIKGLNITEQGLINLHFRLD
jgi:hypothetical protein